MEERERGSGRSGRGNEIFHREVAQTKKDRGGLGCRWLLWGRLSVRNFLSGFIRGRGGRNDGGLEGFSGSRCQVLGGREPLIEFSIAGNAAAEDFPLQL